MKRNLLTCVLCVLLAVPVLTGCGQLDSDSTVPSVSSASEQSAEPAASGDASGDAPATVYPMRRHGLKTTNSMQQFLSRSAGTFTLLTRWFPFRGH